MQIGGQVEEQRYRCARPPGLGRRIFREGAAFDWLVDAAPHIDVIDSAGDAPGVGSFARLPPNS